MYSQQAVPPETEPGILERMLNNPQVTDAQMVQTLVNVYFDQAYRVALEMQPHVPLARQAAYWALAQVVHRRQSYWGEPALEDWIHELVQHSLTIQTKRRQGLPVEAEIGNAEAASPLMGVEQALTELRRRDHRSRQVRIGLLSLSGFFVVILLLGLAGITQVFSLPNPFSRVRFTYPYITQTGDTLDSIAKKAGVRVEDITLQADTAPTKTILPGKTIWLPSLKPGWWQTLFPRRAASPPAPLTLRSTPAEIKQRILESPRYWQTLWAEQVFMVYGPRGYIAPPLSVNRLQIWIRQPNQGLLLIGSVRDPLITSAIYFDGNRVYQTQPAAANLIYTHFLDKSNGIGNMPSPPTLPFLPSFSREEWEVKIIGMETVAGRDTLVVDQYDADGIRESRLWVDTQLGVVLAERWFAESYNRTENQAVLWEQVVLIIQFEVKIPEAMLDPNHPIVKFLKDVKGDPLDAPNLTRPAALQFGLDPTSIRIGHIPPPAGFNVNQSRLTLRLQPLPVDDLFDVESLGSGEGGQSRIIDVFGDDYYLGTLNLHSTGSVSLDFCSRSPDGSLALFYLRTADSRMANWFHLSDPQIMYSLPDGQNSSSLYAFSPSSRQLAYYRCAGWVWCGISLVNFETGEITRFIETSGQSAYWLGYSPDGGTLGVIFYPTENPATTTLATLNIYNLSDGEKTYTGTFDIQSGNAAPDAPTWTWGTAFQILANRSKGCDSP